VQCAANLAQKLQQYVDGDISGFERAAEEEAEELSRSAFGGVLLNLIGTIYMEQGRAELGGIGGLGVNFSQTNRYIGTRSGIPVSAHSSSLSSPRLNLFQKTAQGLFVANDAQKAYARLQEIGKLRVAGELPPEETEEEKELKKTLQKTQGHLYVTSLLLPVVIHSCSQIFLLVVDDIDRHRVDSAASLHESHSRQLCFSRCSLGTKARFDSIGRDLHPKGPRASS
jgi:hypothetical protein